MRKEEIVENVLSLIENKEEEKIKTLKDKQNTIKEVLKKGKPLKISLSTKDDSVIENVASILSSLNSFGVEFIIEGYKLDEPKTNKEPQKEVLKEILEEIIETERACIIEPDKKCVKCEGRCMTLGF